MSDYLQDLVQNIYTKCDMSGFDDLKRGYQQLNGLTKNELSTQKNRLALIEAEEKMQVRLNSYKQVWSEKTAKQIEKENQERQRGNQILRRMGSLLLGYFSVQTLKNIVNTGSKLQLIEKSIVGLTKSTEDWNFIEQQAFKTGTNIEVVARGYRNFFAAANMAGFNNKQIQSMYADVLLSSRAIGANQQQTEGALLALEQMISKGTVSMEELRRQLGNALPGAFEIGAKAMNMTTMEFNKFVRTGKLASAEFVPKFIKTLKETYQEGFTEISGSVDFALVNLRNAWQKITLEIVKSSAGKEFAKMINALTQKLTSPTFISALKTIAWVLGKIVSLIGWLVRHLPQLMPFLIPAMYLGVASAIIGIGKSIVQATRALIGANIVIGSMTASTAALYMNLVGILTWALLIQDAFKGFPSWKHIIDLYNQGKGVNQHDSGENVKPRESENYIYYAHKGKIFRVGKEMYSYAGTRDENGEIVMPSNRLKSQWEQFGRAREVKILPNRQVLDVKTGKVTGYAANADENNFMSGATALNKEETNDYTITMGDVIFNINGANNPQAVAEAINIEFSNLLIGQMGGVTE